jgi:hypothetical protein
VNNGAASGWQEVGFPAPVAVTAHATYTASYHTPSGHYSFDGGYFATNGVTRSPLSAPSSPIGNGNGVYKAGASGFPAFTHNAANYWVDVVYVSVGGDTTPPSVTARTPAPGSSGVSTASNVSAVFNEAMDPASIMSTTVEVRDASNQLVTATVSYDAGARMAVLDPNGSFAFGTTYTARVRGGGSGVRDVFGNALTADVVWSFTTGQTPACPCTIWSPTTVPGSVDSADGGAYELGVKFRAEMDGYVTGVRFYKSVANSGVHIAHLWTSSGTLLASATFSNESVSGWQEVSLNSPVPVTGGATYVASYWAPNGHYSINGSYFSSAGVTSGPLHALGNLESPNGVFRAGSSGFPADSWNGGNYWVDVVYVSVGGDTTPPLITSHTPASGATNVATITNVTALFNEPMDAASITSSTLELQDASNQVVSSAITYDAASRTATIDPSNSLTSGTTYTARVRGGTGGVSDVSGNPLASDVTWSFTTGTAPSCPCTIWSQSTVPGIVDSNDGNAYELGVKFRSDTDGLITGIRFYKSSANTGLHVAHLWTSTGTLLAAANFANESASGWQEVSFASPVAVTAGATYVASYWTPNGRYSINGGYFGSGGTTAGPLRALGNAESPNGVYRAGASGFPADSWNASNYWVDVVFTTQP